MPSQPHTAPAVPRAHRRLRCLIACVLWPLLATLAHADAVTDWNQTALRAAASSRYGHRVAVAPRGHRPCRDVRRREQHRTQIHEVRRRGLTARGRLGRGSGHHCRPRRTDAARAGPKEHARRGPHHHAGHGGRWRSERHGRSGRAGGRGQAARGPEQRRHRRQGRVHARHGARRLAADAAGLQSGQADAARRREALHA